MACTAAPLPWALCGGVKRPSSEATRHKGRVEAYFLLDFLFLFYQEKRKGNLKLALNSMCMEICRANFILMRVAGRISNNFSSKSLKLRT